MEFFGIKLVGINPENGQKLLLTVLFITAIILFKLLITRLLEIFYRHHEQRFIRFWSRQAVNLLSAMVMVLIFLSIWFDDPTRLATGIGLITAGLAFALQKVVTSFAGYLIIIRGNTFSIGERITMGGIRGDVISLGFLQTTIMEMGQPPAVQGASPAMWIQGRQFTGRIVTVTNDKIFETPVYNYTRDFPFIWEELIVPIKYTADRKAAEEILRNSVNKFTEYYDRISHPLREQLQRRYDIQFNDLIPQIYYRLTDNWLELSVRFIVEERGVRKIKSDITKDILEQFEAKGIEIASTTIEIHQASNRPGANPGDTQSASSQNPSGFPRTPQSAVGRWQD